MEKNLGNFDTPKAREEFLRKPAEEQQAAVEAAHEEAMRESEKGDENLEQQAMEREAEEETRGAALPESAENEESAAVEAPGQDNHLKRDEEKVLPEALPQVDKGTKEFVDANGEVWVSARYFRQFGVGQETIAKPPAAIPAPITPPTMAWVVDTGALNFVARFNHFHF